MVACVCVHVLGGGGHEHAAAVVLLPDPHLSMALHALALNA